MTERESAGDLVFRFMILLLRRGRSKHQSPAQQPDRAAELVTVAGASAAGKHPGGLNPTIVLAAPPDGPRRRRWWDRIPRWLRWTALAVIVVALFRRIATWALLAALSGALHLFGISASLPHVTFGWPWSSSSGTSSTTLAGPLVLQKIEGIDSPALGSTTYGFLFTHTVNKPVGFLPCWYSATFYAVGHASATVDLNPGPSWWKPSAGHYALRVLSRPTASAPGRVTVTMALPRPQLPQSPHDVTIDNIPSKPIDTQHSWTYPGFGCGAIIKPQFSVSVLYGQAQNLAFYQSTHNPQVTRPLVAAAEGEATQIIRNDFVQPTVNALGYTLTSFSLRWAGGAVP